MRKFGTACAAFGVLALTALWSSPAHAQVITDPVTGITIDLGGGGGTGGGGTGGGDPGAGDPGGGNPGGGDPGGGDPGSGVLGYRYADQIIFHVHWNTVGADGLTYYRDTDYWMIDYHDESGQSVSYEYRAHSGPVVSIGYSETDAAGNVWTVYNEDAETGTRWRW